MPKAWKQNKEDFITHVSGKYFLSGQLIEKEKYNIERLVDAFNIHAWRASYFISAFLTIENFDYKLWNKQFFKNYYSSGSRF